MLRQALSLLIIIALSGAGYLLLTTDGRQLLDRATINYTRWQNNWYHRDGLPLPGTPELAKFDERLKAQGLALGAPVFLRIFKLELELEIWMERDGRYQKFAAYPICLWSGRLGPKLREGDRQSPEGFYAVTKEELNPNSRWHRSFSLGFPNAFDRAQGRTGSFIMVHGGCQSVGCFAMTERRRRRDLAARHSCARPGRACVQRPGLSFARRRKNFAERKGDEWSAFWADLKKGYDAFERTHLPPMGGACARAAT